MSYRRYKQISDRILFQKHGYNTGEIEPTEQYPDTTVLYWHERFMRMEGVCLRRFLAIGADAMLSVTSGCMFGIAVWLLTLGRI